MTEILVPASWMDEGLLARVAVVVGVAPCVLCGGRRVFAISRCCGNELEEMVVMSAPPAWWVTAGVVCFLAWCAVSWCVKCALGLLPSPVVRSLSLHPRCSVPLPLFAFFLFSLKDQLIGFSDSTTGDDGDGAAPCGVRVLIFALRAAAATRPWCVTAAGSPGDYLVVRMRGCAGDVSCAPSDGSLSYRVFMCVREELFCCQC
ncbi:hypothetical protein TcBrA4_0024520 [Trypanosoma cruzi]|nr:hypothetical protein TcBrA4_0024520 [Trypanosoma cruzi]